MTAGEWGYGKADTESFDADRRGGGAPEGDHGAVGDAGRRLARRREEGRLRWHGIHHGIRGRGAPLDEVVEEKGVRVLIEPSAILFLLGTEMDFKSDKLNSGFVFNNPNQTSACGCGTSVEIAPSSKADAVSNHPDTNRQKT